MIIIKKDLDTWLNEVNYEELNHGKYVPTLFSLMFMNFIKLVNGVQGESHVTPPVHLKMMDKIISPKNRVANLCFRGAAKTTLFFEYFVPFLAVFGKLPNFGDVSGIIYVSDSMDNGVKSARKNLEFRYEASDFLKENLPKKSFTDGYIEFENKDGHRLGIKLFGAKTGLRGTKIFGKRPVIAILDDLVSDDDAKSKVTMQAIKDTVYKGVDYALDPTRQKIFFNGTPFTKDDIMIEAIESGAWDVNVWPVCEKFPVEKEEFRGAWEDRFSYDYVKAQYDRAVLAGKLPAFYQELMLRISSEEERLIQDKEINWYSRIKLLEKRSIFNFYITTDFATSDKESADNSVISVWAYNSNGDWFWVDGICARQTMDKTINDLFRLVQEYRPISVGVETSGTQRAFISWLQQEMMIRNVWFTFASSEKNGEAGIRPTTNKLVRFNLVVPLFKAGKIFFPEEMKLSIIVGEFISEIKLVTNDGIKGKDDCLDTISMLMYLNPWKPSENTSDNSSHEFRWGVDEDELDNQISALNGYIV